LQHRNERTHQDARVAQGNATALLLLNAIAGYRWSSSTEAWTAAK
jgi:hypothetical protein